MEGTKMAKRAAGLTAAAFLFAGCMFIPPEEEIIEGAPEGVSASERYQTLVWSDEFDAAGTLNAPSGSNWGYQLGAGGWGNNEVQTYTDTRANSWVDNGTLKVKAVKANGSWTSARLRGINKQEWTYGYMEAKIKLPAGNGVWPAFWMMPTDSVYDSWPRSGEIDIMEYSPGTVGVNQVYGTVHFGESIAAHAYPSIGKKEIPTATSEFHRYGVEWTDDSISWFVDGVPVGIPYRKTGDWKVWPFDQDFHFILNVAMGGNLGGSISPSLTQAIMEVDYVRVYR